MIVLCFGSKILEGDDTALKVCEVLKKSRPELNVKVCDDPYEIMNYEETVIIVDVVKDLDRSRFIDLSSVKERKIFTTHDLDLSFFLKIFAEVKPRKISILGIPWKKPLDEVIADVEKLLDEFYLEEMGRT
jgi:Ni,Fe-hydrogenase maturation factor